MEAAIKRILPHSAEAEQAVVGAMLMNKDAIVVASEIVTGEDFYQTAYGILFDAMVELFQAGKPVDLITLQEHLKEKNVILNTSSALHSICPGAHCQCADFRQYQILCGDCAGKVHLKKAHQDK